MRLYWYKNYSYKAKTYHGVEFKPGEIKQVPHLIRDSKMVRIFKKAEKEAKKSVEEIKPAKKRSPGRPRKSSKPSIKEKSNFGEESIENKVLEENKEESE